MSFLDITVSNGPTADSSTVIMEDFKVLKKYGYSLGNTLGEGTFGTVKFAFSQRLKRKVAIKIIDMTTAQDDFLKKFLPRELQILGSLKHDNIVHTLEIFEKTNGKIYIVMELSEHGDLLQFINSRGALSEDFSRKLFKQLSEAIQYLHDSDVVHRDLKCENLLLDKDYNLKVADFDFSRRLTYNNGQMVLSKTYCGTTAYTAPEVLQGIPYDPRASDVWSMGIVLYMMLYGLMPYDDSNVRQLVKIQKLHQVHFPSDTSVSSEVKELIICILHPVVTQRIKVAEILQHPWLLLRATTQKSNNEPESVQTNEEARMNSNYKSAPEEPPSSAGAGHNTPATEPTDV